MYVCSPSSASSASCVSCVSSASVFPSSSCYFVPADYHYHAHKFTT
jgi:hypothetical protein